MTAPGAGDAVSDSVSVSDAVSDSDGQPVRRGRGRPRDAATDRAILAAALDLFIERGVDGASMEQIAKRAGVGKLTVYRRWSSKAELLAQAIETIRAPVSDPLPDDSAEVSLTELVETALPGAAAVLAEPRFAALISQIFGSRVSHPSLLETYWKHFVEPRRATLHTLLSRAQREGQLNPDANLEVIIDMTVGATIYRALQPNPPDLAESRTYLESVYRHAGLLPNH